MDSGQSRFLGELRKHIHDYIVGRFEPRYALVPWPAAPGTLSPWAKGTAVHRAASVASRIDQMEDRLFEPGTLAVGRRVGEPMGGQLRGARMFGPMGKLEGQEQMLSDADQEELMNLAALLRGVAGETKAWLGAFLQSDEATLTKSEEMRLKTALDWLKVSENSFKMVPLQIDLVRQRRAGRVVDVPSRGGAFEGLLPAHKGGLSAAIREAISTYVIESDTDQPLKKEVDDGDVFNDFKAGLGALRQAWFKIAMAMVSAPPEDQPPKAELVAAFAQDGLKVEMGELVEMPQLATPNRRMTPNERFGWPRVAF